MGDLSLLCSTCRRVLGSDGAWVPDPGQPGRAYRYTTCPECYTRLTGRSYHRWMGVGLRWHDYMAAEAHFARG